MPPPLALDSHPTSLRFEIDGSVYAIAVLYQLVFICSRVQILRDEKLSIFVCLTILVSSITRGFWMFARAEMDPQGSLLCFILDRVSLCTDIFAFFIVAAEFGVQVGEQDPVVLRWVTLAIVLLVSIVQVGYILLRVLDVIDIGTWYENVDLIVLLFLCWMTSLAFFQYGRKLSTQLALDVADPYRNENQKYEIGDTARKVKALSVVASLCFGLRTCFWIYGACIFDWEILRFEGFVASLDPYIYPTFYYTLPDLIPSIVMLHMILSKGNPPSRQVVIVPSNKGGSVQQQPFVVGSGDDGTKIWLISHENVDFRSNSAYHDNVEYLTNSVELSKSQSDLTALLPEALADPIPHDSSFRNSLSFRDTTTCIPNPEELAATVSKALQEDISNFYVALPNE